MKQQKKQAGITVFYSYAHEDEPFRKKLEKCLSMLRRQGLISEWHDRQIVAGTEWAKVIDEHLETASVILLLVSSDFLASDYCYDVEMHHALERHAQGKAHVLPVILRPCEWQEAPFAHLQVLPSNGKSVIEWDNQDIAFLDITRGIRRVLGLQIPSARPLLSLSPVDRKRTRLLKQVRAIWIEGLLEQSLHQEALIALNLQKQPDALANPWRLHVQETNRPPNPLPARTSIADAYAHGMRNEMHMLLKRLRRTVQCSCSFWGGAKNTSAFWKTGGLERMLSSSIAADLKESRNE